MTVATWLMTILQRHSPAPRILRTSNQQAPPIRCYQSSDEQMQLLVAVIAVRKQLRGTKMGRGRDGVSLPGVREFHQQLGVAE